MRLFSLMLSCWLFLLANADPSVEIPLRPIAMPVPEISSGYSIVHTTIYPTERFASLPKDFYVAKILKNKPRAYSLSLPQ